MAARARCHLGGYYALTDLFIVAAIIYDMVSLRRVSGAYVWGGLLVVSAQLARELVGPTAVWHASTAASYRCVGRDVCRLWLSGGGRARPAAR